MRFIVKFLATTFILIIISVSLGCKEKDVSKPALFSVDPALRSLKTGGQFKYSVDQADNKGRKTFYQVRFTSANPNVAIVDNKGTVTAKRNGSAKIKVRCKDKSFTVKVDVYDELFSMHLPEQGIIAENGFIILRDVGGIHNVGYVVNYFGDNKGYLQIMFSIKNISDQNLLIDPDHFIMLGDQKEIVRSMNSKLSKPKYKGLLRKRWLKPKQTIEKMVIFMRPRFSFNMNQVKIIYNDGKNPKITYDLNK